MDSLFATLTATVVSRWQSGNDESGRPTWEVSRREVPGVLLEPVSSEDTDAQRGGGSTRRARAHFPKGHAEPLAGCDVVIGGETWHVVGDPTPFMPENTPGPFGTPVELVMQGGA